MIRWLYFLLLPLAFSCQQPPDAKLTADLAHLRQREQDLIKTQKLTQDSLLGLRKAMTNQQQELEFLTRIANEHPHDDVRQKFKPVKAQPPFGLLYHKPVVAAVANEELAEVLCMADSTVEYAGVKALRVCNGPADVTVDACNCSHYIYLAMSTAGLPVEYKIYRIGPFMEAKFAGWETPVNQENSDQTILRIQHRMVTRPQTDAFRVSWDKVELLK